MIQYKFVFFLLENVSTSPITPPTTTTTSIATPPSHLYYSHSWIPHNIEISLNNSGELFVEKMNSPKVIPTESNKCSEEAIVENGQGDGKVQEESESPGIDSEGKNTENHIITGPDNGDGESANATDESSNKMNKMQYSLSAVVCYIDDKSNEDRRNIVALLRVGPNYHERSTGSAVSQWYILNDFW